MNLFDIGIPEILFILLLALIIFGPKDLQKTGRALGKWLNSLVRSDTWRVLRETSKGLSNLPSRLMREANLEEIAAETGKGLSIAPPEMGPSIDEPPIINSPTIQPPASSTDGQQKHPDAAGENHA